MNPLTQLSPRVVRAPDDSMQADAGPSSLRAEVDAAVRHDRDHIASDLHDSVIQRIFATAMSVDALRAKQPDGEIDADVAHIVDELDRCIVEIRSVIYRLCPDEGTGGLESDLLAVLEEEGPAWGLSPRFSSPVTSGLWAASRGTTSLRSSASCCPTSHATRRRHASRSSSRSAKRSGCASATTASVSTPPSCGVDEASGT
jgi:hypothetical protein